MKLLAFDTSGERLSLALYDGGKKLAEFESGGFTRPSETLVPSLKKTLLSRRLKIDDIDCLAVGLGPGSFTGLRVGIMTAKTLAYALKKKIVGVSSLEAMAHGARGLGSPVAVILDAKKDKCYAALYEIKKSGLKPILKPTLLPFSRFLSRAPRSAVAVGTAVFPHAERVKKSRPAWKIPPESHWHAAKAASVAEIAVKLIQKKKFTDPFRLEPLYLHARDCNVTMKRK